MMKKSSEAARRVGRYVSVAARLSVMTLGLVLLGLFLQVVAYKFVPVVDTPFMRTLACKNHVDVNQRWVPLSQISKAMPLAVVSSEDNLFTKHHGFSWNAIKAAAVHNAKAKRIHGASTISQQTAKNCFTWCSKTWLRKGIEAYFTVLIEKIWGKERILEVYLNVAEMGPGIYGAEAAAKRYFHIHASDLTMADASSIVCCLPNPLHRDPNWANRYMSSRRAQIAYDAARMIPAA